MSPKANHRPHRAHIINYHMVGILRYRKKVWIGPVEARLKELPEQEVPLAEIATQYGFEILAIEVMLRNKWRNPMHLFVSAPPSEHSFAASFGVNSAYMPWAEEYSVGMAGQVSAETIKCYIAESKRKSFKS